MKNQFYTNSNVYDYNVFHELTLSAEDIKWLITILLIPTVNFIGTK